MQTTDKQLKPVPLGEDERSLQELIAALLARNTDTIGDEIHPPGGLPPVRPAPPFRPEPFTVGPPELVSAVSRLMQIAPDLKGHISGVTEFPHESAIVDNENVLERLDGSAYKPFNDYPYHNLNVMGEYFPQNRSIYVNPSNYNDELWSTTGHEAGHALKLRHGDVNLTLMEELMRRIGGYKR